MKKRYLQREIPENENPNKTVDIVEDILGFKKQQEAKGIKISELMLKDCPYSCTNKSR